MQLEPLEVFNFLKPKFNYIAYDRLGWFAFDSKPIFLQSICAWVSAKNKEPSSSNNLNAIDIEFLDFKSYETSIFERPKLSEKK